MGDVYVGADLQGQGGKPIPGSRSREWVFYFLKHERKGMSVAEKNGFIPLFSLFASSP
jgi:hypothetical protein